MFLDLYLAWLWFYLIVLPFLPIFQELQFYEANMAKFQLIF